MATTLQRSERVGDEVPLPSEVVKIIEKTIKERPENDVPTIVSEVVETLAGTDPDNVVAWSRSARGRPRSFGRSQTRHVGKSPGS